MKSRWRRCLPASATPANDQLSGSNTSRRSIKSGGRQNHPMPRKYVSPKDVFWAKVNRAGPTTATGITPCWVWTSSRNRAGRYGMVRFSPWRDQLAHRVSWFLHTGNWPTLYVLHQCDNVLCVRPEHLFLGDQTVKMRDMMAKGRRYYAKGEQCHAAKLNERQVREIKQRIGHSSYRAIGRQFGVSDVLIHHIANGRIWNHVA